MNIILHWSAHHVAIARISWLHPHDSLKATKSASLGSVFEKAIQK